MTARFNAAELAQIADLLAAQQRTLAERIALHREGRSRVEQASDILEQDDDDAEQHDADREVELALSDVEVVEQARLDQAVARLHDADFGRCVDCGEDIPFARMKVQPWAQRCVACEAQRERASGRQRAPTM